MKINKPTIILTKDEKKTLALSVQLLENMTEEIEDNGLEEVFTTLRDELQEGIEALNAIQDSLESYED